MYMLGVAQLCQILNKDTHNSELHSDVQSSRKDYHFNLNIYQVYHRLAQSYHSKVQIHYENLKSSLVNHLFDLGARICEDIS